MPPLVDQPGIIRLTHKFSVGADTNAIVRWFLSYTGGPPSAGTLNTIATAIRTAFTSDLAPFMGTANSLLSITLQDLASSMGAVGEDATAVAGTRSGSILPAGAALLVNYGIVRHYRGGKPRSYWPFGVDGDLATEQTWSSTFLTNVQGGLEAYLTAIEAAGTGGVTLTGIRNVSYYAGVEAPVTLPSGRVKQASKPRTVAITPDVINSINPSAKVGSQRRRYLQRS